MSKIQWTLCLERLFLSTDTWEVGQKSGGNIFTEDTYGISELNPIPGPIIYFQPSGLKAMVDLCLEYIYSHTLQRENIFYFWIKVQLRA